MLRGRARGVHSATVFGSDVPAQLQVGGHPLTRKLTCVSYQSAIGSLVACKQPKYPMAAVRVVVIANEVVVQDTSYLDLNMDHDMALINRRSGDCFEASVESFDPSWNLGWGSASMNCPDFIKRPDVQCQRQSRQRHQHASRCLLQLHLLEPSWRAGRPRQLYYKK